MADAKTERPSSFQMEIQGGLLEALGINMYTTLGKCLVEFVANGYDGEANNVTISIPLKDIETARKAARATAKKEVEEGKREPFSVLLIALPENLEVVISDDGHGMTPAEVRDKFLPLNRKRRQDEKGDETKLLSESAKRNVMGRKGLGKLAGFGAAELITVRTKRTGETFATEFTMDFRVLQNAPSLERVKIPAKYIEEQAAESHGTTITLSRLKCDAVRYGMDSMTETLADAFFGINPADFSIKLNDVIIEAPPASYEFLYPKDRPYDGLARHTVVIEDIGTLDLDYVVKFRARGGNLKTSQRGARIYCNNRLAAGPSLLDLPTGMHNFHSQSYMECIVRADDLDRHGIDFINTNRTTLKQDNEVVQAVFAAVTEIMRLALAAHAKFREDQAAIELQRDESAKQLTAIIERMPTRTRESAKRLLRSIAVQHGIGSVEFTELAPLVIDTMNAGDVLIRLIELGSDPGTVQNVANHLVELAQIEKSDALKLYRGRRSGIVALQKLADRGEDLWKKKGVEKELHALFKEEPWLIRTEYSRYLTSDENLEKVASKLAKVLEIDKFSGIDENSSEPDLRRPDLVFAMTDMAVPNVVNIVELKSPSIPLEIDHLMQLKGYMMTVEKWLERHLQRGIAVHGFLVGTYPIGEKISQESQQLLYEIEKAGPEAPWKVFGIRQLIEIALRNHLEVIGTLEKEVDDTHSEIISIAPAAPRSLPPPSEASRPGGYEVIEETVEIPPDSDSVQ